MDFISLAEVSSTNSETAMCPTEKVLREKDIDIKKNTVLLPRWYKFNVG